MKSIFKVGFVAAVFAVATWAGSAEGGILYFLQDNDSAGNSHLYSSDTFDFGTPSYSWMEIGVGNSNPQAGSTRGLAFDPVSMELLGSTPDQFYRLDQSNIRVSDLPLVDNGSGIENGVEGLAYDSVTGTLFGYVHNPTSNVNDGFRFFTIDPASSGATATTTTIPNLPPAIAGETPDLDGLAFGEFSPSNGAVMDDEIRGVFGLDDISNQLLFYDPLLDTWTVIGEITLGGDAVAFDDPGLAYDTDLNVLYALGNARIVGPDLVEGIEGEDPSILYSIDPNTGVATIIGNTGITGRNGGGLAYVSTGAAPPNPVPEPASIAIWAMGLLGMGWFGRKRLMKARAN